MNAQTSRMSGVSAAGWSLSCLSVNATRACTILALLVLAPGMCAAPAGADEYDIIIEKNLFHDQRQKWEMQDPQSKGGASSGGSAEEKNIDQISLFGTVVRDSHSYAVMRVTQPQAPKAAPRAKPPKAVGPAAEEKQEDKRPYAVGDFISGYRLVEIRSGSVLLQDPANNKQFEVFMNQGEAERSTVRTEIIEDKPQPAQPPDAPGGGRPPAPRPQPAPEPAQNPAQSADFMRQRIQKDMQMLRDNQDAAAMQQVERDWEKLEPMIPSLEESGREDLMRLKEEFEKMQQE